MANLRWKVLIVVLVTVIFTAVGVYPIVAARYGITSPAILMNRALKLGLDLQGGVHLVLRVQTDDALRIESESEMERLRERLSTAGITTTNLVMATPTSFKVEGVSGDQDAGFRAAANEVSTNFERDAGTAACIVAAVLRGAAILRVHNIEMTWRTVETVRAVKTA